MMIKSSFKVLSRIKSMCHLYSLNRSISSGSVKLSVFLRALSLMGYTLEIKKEGKTVVSIRPEDYAPVEKEEQKE